MPAGVWSGIYFSLLQPMLIHCASTSTMHSTVPCATLVESADGFGPGRTLKEPEILGDLRKALTRAAPCRNKAALHAEDHKLFNKLHVMGTPINPKEEGGPW
mmetsp:Transcript_1333/g.1550  ORF Transcript_1333/g.1550 Transcript_1333/m.1550 type:complete len:102 (-) Transcript_1333:281-586(-)